MLPFEALGSVEEGSHNGGSAYVSTNYQYFDFAGDGKCDCRNYIKLARVIEWLEMGPAGYWPSGLSAGAYSQAGESRGASVQCRAQGSSGRISSVSVGSIS